MRSDWWKFNESMTSGTRPPVRNIRRGEEGMRASDLGQSENQAIRSEALCLRKSMFLYTKQNFSAKSSAHSTLKAVEYSSRS